MREPLRGEEPSSIAERMLKNAGHKRWKLERDDIDLIRPHLAAAWNERSAKWMEAFLGEPAWKTANREIATAAKQRTPDWKL